MKLHSFLSSLAFASAALLVATTTPALAGPNTVRLFAERVLQPTTTLEVRFEDTMVPVEKIGTVAEQQPIVINPAVKGSFVWLEPAAALTPEEPVVCARLWRMKITPLAGV